MCRAGGEGESLGWKCGNSSPLNAARDVAWEMGAAAGGVFHTQRDSGKSKEANSQGKQVPQARAGRRQAAAEDRGLAAERRALERMKNKAGKTRREGQMSAVEEERRERKA